MKEDIEQKWIRRIKILGAKREADLLVRAYYDEIYQYVCKQLYQYNDAYDLTQEIFISIMVISLFTIFCFGIERQNLTDAIIYSSKKGRSLVKHKIMAAGVVSVCFVLLLYILTLTLFFTIWDFNGIWNTNVSSSFHYVIDLNLPYNKPFLTWVSFSVKEYFISSLFLEMAVLVIWWMVSSCIGILSSHSVKGFMILAAFFILPYFFSHFFEGLRLWGLFFINTFTISMLTINQHIWFTEMGAFEILPWQEVLSVLIHLLMYSIILYAAIRIFRRKELS